MCGLAGKSWQTPLWPGRLHRAPEWQTSEFRRSRSEKKQEGVEALKDEDPPEGSRLPIFPASLRGGGGWEGKISLVLPNTAEASTAPEAETTSRRSHALFPDRRRFESVPGNVLLVIAVKTGNSLMKECLKRNGVWPPHF